MNILRIGAHISVSGGKHLAFESGKELGCEAIQVFVRNVRGWTSGPLKQKEIDDFINKHNDKFPEKNISLDISIADNEIIFIEFNPLDCELETFGILDKYIFPEHIINMFFSEPKSYRG